MLGTVSSQLKLAGIRALFTPVKEEETQRLSRMEEEESDPRSVKDVLLEDYQSAVEYAQDILQLLTSDDLLKRTSNQIAVLQEIKSEIQKSSNCLASTTKSKFDNFGKQNIEMGLFFTSVRNKARSYRRGYFL